jgi:hypothetical protein
MPNYKLGKIYKIVSPSHPEVPPYFGSTCQSLSMRMAGHRADFKRGKLGTSKKLMCFEDAIILLVEEYPCENREQLCTREGEIMINSVERSNKHIAGRTRAEYVRQKYTCLCGSTINLNDKSQHEKTKKHIAFISPV